MNAGLITAEQRAEIGRLMFDLYPVMASHTARVWVSVASGSPVSVPLARLTTDQAQDLIRALRGAQGHPRPFWRRRAPQHRRAAA